MKRISILFITVLTLACIQGFAQTPGIWISEAEIDSLPTSGAAWDNLKARADQSCGTVDLSNQDQSNNVCIMAKALVFAKIGGDSYLADTLAALRSIVNMGTYNGRALALGRELGAYVIAADLINLKTKDSALDEEFRGKIKALLTTPTSSGPANLIDCHEDRPNNWGTHCGGARAAVDAYLGDTQDLALVAQVFKGWLGDRSSYAGFTYGDLSWQCNPALPVGINPIGCTKDGRSIDGVLPDDERRAGSFTWPPPQENYVYEALQGALMQAVILHRAGYPDVFDWQDQALLRAFQWLHEQAGFPATGDDGWQPFVINYYYGKAFPASSPASPGKNVGWTDWTHAGNYNPTRDSIPPFISDVTASVISTTSATIMWKTDEDSTGRIDYGTSDSYGTSLVCHSSILARSHSGTLSGLQSGTQYHYRVVSLDAAGNEATSQDGTFTTVSHATQPPAPQLPSGDFVGSPVSGTAPLTVDFSDISTGSPTNWLWDFGDGTKPEAQSQTATHTYTADGRYTVTLSVTNGAGSNTITKRNYITVRASRLKQVRSPLPESGQDF